MHWPQGLLSPDGLCTTTSVDLCVAPLSARLASKGRPPEAAHLRYAQNSPVLGQCPPSPASLAGLALYHAKSAATCTVSVHMGLHEGLMRSALPYNIMTCVRHACTATMKARKCLRFHCRLFAFYCTILMTETLRLCRALILRLLRVGSCPAARPSTLERCTACSTDHASGSSQHKRRFRRAARADAA